MSAGRAWTGWALLTGLAVTAAIVVHESVLAAAIILTDGLIAAGVLAAATLAGLWIVRLLGLHEQGLAWQLLLAAGLGIGGLSLLVLLLGLLGLLQRWLWIGLLVGLGCAGLVRLGQMARAGTLSARPTAGPLGWAWLLAAPFLALALLVATVPPGLCWRAEAHGYDVLEYHLQAPKEYFQAGRIHFLRHNIYSNMPANAERLYLLAMVLKADVWQAVYLAKLLNAAMAILTVAAAWLLGRQFGPAVAVLSGVLMATCPWLSYLSGLAYVENGMLFQASLSLAAFLRWLQQRHEPRAWRWALAAGLLSGLACGYKYTAVAMLAAPLVILAAILTLASPPRRPTLLWLFVVSTLVAFGPWLARNFRMTGNPVFPLAYRLLGSKSYVWNDDLAERWARAHQPDPQKASLAGRLAALNDLVLRSPMYGRLIPLALAVPILLSRRRSWSDAAAVALIVAVLTVWLLTTHLVDRFAVLLLPALVLLGGRSWQAWNSRIYRAAIILALVASAGLNLEHVGRLYYDHLRVGPARPFGRVDAFLAAQWDNDLPGDARVLMVADARAFYVRRSAYYAVVFSPNRLAELIEAGTPPRLLLDWLMWRGYTHIYVHWAEMDRLRRTYGFWPQIDRRLFDRLERAGLVRFKDLSDSKGLTYATIYRIEPR